MLALPRIATAQSGVGSSNHTGKSGKAPVAVNESFGKMLAGLRSATAEPTSNGNTATVSHKAAFNKQTRLEPRKAVERRSTKNGIASEPSTQTRRVVPNQETNHLAVTTAVPVAKAVAATTVPHEEKPVAKGEKPRNGNQAADGIEAGILAAAARAATLSVTDKGSAPRTHVDKSASGARGERNDQGIETVGARTETNRNGTKVTVMDMRMKAARDNANRQGPTRSRPEGEASADAVKHDASMTDVDTSLAGRPMTRTGGESGTLTTLNRESSVASPQTFAEALASRLQTGAADIVRSAQIVLQNGDIGIIRLRLDPDSLGGVKIELKMTEKQISGKIIVESDIAGEAFRSSLDALKDAFAESGFETTSLEVEVRNDMATGAGTGKGDGEQGDDEGPYWSRSLRELEAAVPVLETVGRNGQLDVFV